uniref:NADAR domain-containing protein n=1 Tax=Panagrolaimus sp. ES5 TaxID=591445 RepID=A0AC34FTN4_9BILA
MATPITIREREAAVERNRKKREQNYRQQQRPTSSSNNANSFVPNVYRPIPAYQPQNVDFSEDVAIQNFDWDDWQISRPISIPSAQNISYKDITIDKDNVYVFHGKTHFMSTFYEVRINDGVCKNNKEKFQAPFKLRNHNYPNVETYYEACKLFCLIHYSCSTLVQKARYAAAAKKIASDMMRKYKIPRKVIDEWKLREGAQAVYNATLAKFEENPDLKKKLLDTGDKLIVQCYEKDGIFGSGCSQIELDEWFKKNDGKVIKIASDMMRKYKIPRKVVDEWKLREGAQAVYNATLAKFEENPDLKKKLLDTGDKLIVQCYEKDGIFGSGCSQIELDEWFKKNDGKVIKIPIGAQIQPDKAFKVGKGCNLLGYFCMSIREQLRQMEEEDTISLQTLSLL